MSTILEFHPSTTPSLPPSSLISQIIDLHISCVLADHLIARFLPPFTAEKKARMAAFYSSRLAAVEAGSQHLFLCLEGADDPASARVTGIVFLSKPAAETGPFRASVELLMVSPEHRRRGIARRLMGVLEGRARERRRTLLLLDTEEGSDAEFVYPRLGWKEVGRIPDYGYSPKDHRLVSGVFFYKALEKPEKEPYAPL